MPVASNGIKALPLFIRLRQGSPLARPGHRASALPDSPSCEAVSMAYLTVRGKTLRGYVGDDPVARDYRDYHGWEALLLGG